MAIIKILFAILLIHQTKSDGSGNQDGAQSNDSENGEKADTIFWEDKETKMFVIDNFSLENIELFRVQLSNIGVKFSLDLDDYNVVTSYHTPFIPKRYKTQYLKNLTRRVEKLYPEENVDKLSLSVFQDLQITRNDFNPLKESCIKENSSIISIIFLNKNWHKNDYGDIAIYDESDEIVTSFHPRYGRVIVMRCGTKYRIGPPSLRDILPLHLRYIEFTTQKPTPKITGKEDNTVFEDLLDDDEKININIEKELSITDFSPYISRKVETDHHKKPIYIFDNLIPNYIVDSLATMTTRYGLTIHDLQRKREYNKEDSKLPKEYRGTNMLQDVPFSNFYGTHIWRIIKNVTKFVANGVDTYANYDRFATHVRRNTHCFVHTDAVPGDNEYTSVVYLTRDWEANNYGETIFLENNDLAYAIVPKYGRLVVFEGSIEHTSRPPSPNHEGKWFTYSYSSFMISV